MNCEKYLTEEELFIINLLRRNNFIIRDKQNGDIFVEYLILFEENYIDKCIRYLCPGFDNEIFDLHPIVRHNIKLMLAFNTVGPTLNTKINQYLDGQVINCMTSIDYTFGVESKDITILRY